MSNKARYEEWSNLNPVLLSFHPCLGCRASKTLHFAVLGFTALLWACIPDNPTRNCYLLVVCLLTFCARLHAFSTIRSAFKARQWHKHQLIPYIQCHLSLFTTSYCSQSLQILTVFTLTTNTTALTFNSSGWESHHFPMFKRKTNEFTRTQSGIPKSELPWVCHPVESS